MTRTRLFLLNILLLLITVPWFANATNLGSIIGVPNWAIYALFSTFFYALCICYFLHRYWTLSSSHKKLDK